MEVNLLTQAVTFGGAVLLGAALGLVYDFFRVLRRRLRLPLLGTVLDLLFWVLVTVGLFLYAILKGGGQLRLYMTVALFLGAVVYFLTLSRPALIFADLVADALTAFFRILVLPVIILARFAKKLKNFSKQHFHYAKKWYSIKLIPEDMEDLTRRASGDPERRRRGADKKGRAAHQDRGAGPSNLYGDNPSESPGPDTGSRTSAGQSAPSGDGADSGQRRFGRRCGKSQRSGAHSRHRKR